MRLRRDSNRVLELYSYIETQLSPTPGGVAPTCYRKHGVECVACHRPACPPELLSHWRVPDGGSGMYHMLRRQAMLQEGNLTEHLSTRQGLWNAGMTCVERLLFLSATLLLLPSTTD